MKKTYCLFSVAGLFLLTSCDVKPSRGPMVSSPAAVVGEEEAMGPVPKELPKAPLDVPVPKALASTHNGTDLSKEDTDELASLAREAASRDDYKTALAAQFWAVKKGNDGLYDLACYYARNQLHDEAFYWLQQASLTEGVDAQHASTDSDLQTLRRDPRYTEVAKFLRQCSAYWSHSDKKQTLVYLPQGFDKSKPSPVVITLHGRGSRPDHFFGAATQEMANENKLPFICVSGTKPTGPKSFVWSDSARENANRIDAAIKEVEDRIKIAPGRIIAIGFSEGAQVALEVAARDPDRFAGAIGMSPGADFHLNQVQPAPALKTRRFVVTIGGKEHPGNVALARQDRDWFQKAGVQVQHITFPGVGHMLPRDFDERFPKWVEFILSGK